MEAPEYDDPPPGALLPANSRLSFSVKLLLDKAISPDSLFFWDQKECHALWIQFQENSRSHPSILNIKHRSKYQLGDRVQSDGLQNFCPHKQSSQK